MVLLVATIIHFFFILWQEWRRKVYFSGIGLKFVGLLFFDRIPYYWLHIVKDKYKSTSKQRGPAGVVIEGSQDLLA
jgi:hypothetical protein